MRPLIAVIVFVVSATACSFNSQILRQAQAIPAINADYKPAKGDSMAGAYKELWERLEAGGVTVHEEANLVNPQSGTQVWGLTFRNQHHIDIEATADVNARFEILCHEAGHLFHNAALTYAQAEIFAEIVGANLQDHYGVRGAKEKAAAYLAGYKNGADVAKTNKLDIEIAIKALTGKIEWHASPQ